MSHSHMLNARALRRGLTLIELVVVIAILAVLAVMVIPRLDFLKGQAEHASGAATAGDLGTMIQTFKASSGRYPSFDTLISTTGTLFTKLQAQTAASALEVYTIPGPGAPGTSDWYRSLTDGGFLFGYTHNDSATDASNSATTAVDMQQAAYGSMKVATVKSSGGGSLATALRTALYPGGATFIPASDPDGIPGNEDDVAATTTQLTAGTIPATSKLVVFGVGPKCTLVGNVLASAPSSAMASDDSAATYCRYLVVFEIFQSGAPAKFKMVTDHRFRQIGARIDFYKQGSAMQMQ